MVFTQMVKVFTRRPRAVPATHEFTGALPDVLYRHALVSKEVALRGRRVRRCGIDGIVQKGT